MSDKVFHVGDADFESEVLNSDLPVLVDFWAEWCAPCKAIGPLIDELAESQNGKLKVVKVNIDQNPMTPRQYAVRGIPTLMVFTGGKVQGTHAGMLNRAQLTDLVEKSV